jgi:acyl-coenzyme A synthetase/AMP-(fatty) acid ligase
VELENILVTHESVVNAAVIGVDDEEDGEVPMGFVTVRDGCAVGEQELIDYVNERVNSLKQMKGGLVILDKFPTTSLGKINKTKLKQLSKKY